MTIFKDVSSVCKKLYFQGWLANCDGNVSVRIDKNKIKITPRGKPKAHLTEDEMISIDIDPWDKAHQDASSEQAMHKFIYSNVDSAVAVVHAHPPYATAWGLQKDLKYLPPNMLSEGILACGDIPVAKYSTPGTPSMGSSLGAFLPKHKVMILAHHGAITWGDSLDEAYFGMERLEHIAKTLYLAKTLGNPAVLSQSQVDELYQLRTQIGDKIL